MGGTIGKNVNGALNLTATTLPFGSFTTTTGGGGNNGYPYNQNTGILVGSAAGALTFGTHEKFFNVSGGIATVSSFASLSSSNSTAIIPMLSAGGFSRINNKWAFMTDNTLFINPTTSATSQASSIPLLVLSAGARHFLGRNTSMDFGLTQFTTSNTYTTSSYYPYSYPPTTVTTTTFWILPYVGLKAYW